MAKRTGRPLSHDRRPAHPSLRPRNSTGRGLGQSRGGHAGRGAGAARRGGRAETETGRRAGGEAGNVGHAGNRIYVH